MSSAQSNPAIAIFTLHRRNFLSQLSRPEMARINCSFVPLKEAGWQEKHRFDLPEKLLRLVALKPSKYSCKHNRRTAGRRFRSSRQKNLKNALKSRNAFAFEVPDYVQSTDVSWVWGDFPFRTPLPTCATPDRLRARLQSLLMLSQL